MRPVGRNLERGRSDAASSRQRSVWSKTVLYLTLVVLTIAAFPKGEVTMYTAQVGDTWQRETLVAPYAFAIHKSPDSLNAERRAARYSTPPIFAEVTDVQDRISAHRDTVRSELDDIFAAYESFVFNKSRGRFAEAAEDSARYAGLRSNSRLKLTAEQWERLVEDYVARVPGLATATREASGTRLDQRLLRDAWEFSIQLVNSGVLNMARDSILTDDIIVRNEQARTERTVEKDNFFGINEVYGLAQDFFRQQYEADADLVNSASAFVRAIFVSSLEYQRGETMRAWRQAESLISPTRGRVAENEEIIRKGQVITPDVRQKIVSLERAQLERGGTRLQWKRVLGQIMLSMAIFGVFFLYLYTVRQSLFKDNRKMLLMTLLLSIIIGFFALAIRLPFDAMYAVPVAMVSVLLTVIFDSRVGLFGTLTLALLGGLLLGFDYEFTLATLFGGTLGVFSVRDIKNRGQFVMSAGLVFVGYVLVMLATWLFLGRSAALLGSDLLAVGINSVLLMMAYPLLWIFERSFEVTTDLALLELSDTNRPLLKELSLRAPGTFNHSLQVSNLAEAAAAAIGANALLTRVGALYHDIGKMLKPEYFVENQRPGHNPHDQLKPRMSALIIASHVKEGLEMGRQYRLPARVLEFIPMHHGTTRIEYFYRKALEEHKEGEPPLQEAEFRYPGPRPSTKETGILMLSDGVEAASRSLSDPTHKRLESLIDMIVKARIEDGQLDDTALTFEDLKKIKETFLTLLLGIYHIRVKYPGQEKEIKKAQADQDAQPTEQEVSDSKAVADMRDAKLIGIPEQSIAVPSEEEVPEEAEVSGGAEDVNPAGRTREDSAPPINGSASTDEPASSGGDGVPEDIEPKQENP